VIQVLSVLTVGFCKISVLLLYRKLFTVPAFKLASLIGVVIACAWIIAFTLVTIFQCKPISLYWTELEFLWGDACIQIIPFYQAQAVTDIVTDFAILAMPLRMIWNLHLPTKQKWAVTGMFALGLVASASSIARLVVFFVSGNQIATDFTDITYLTSPIFIWTLIEASLSVVCACLPTLRPIFSRSSFRTIGSGYKYHSGDNSGVNRGAWGSKASNHKSAGSQSSVAGITSNGVNAYAERYDMQPLKTTPGGRQGIVVQSEISSYASNV